MASPQMDPELLEEVKNHSPSREVGEQYASDKEWITANRDALLKKHPENWVAVYKGEVVAVHPNLRDIVEILREKKLGGLDVAAEFITAHRMNMLL